jgi:hypothetical protein
VLVTDEAGRIQALHQLALHQKGFRKVAQNGLATQRTPGVLVGGAAPRFREDVGGGVVSDGKERELEKGCAMGKRRLGKKDAGREKTQQKNDERKRAREGRQRIKHEAQRRRQPGPEGQKRITRGAETPSSEADRQTDRRRQTDR